MLCCHQQWVHLIKMSLFPCSFQNMSQKEYYHLRFYFYVIKEVVGASADLQPENRVVCQARICHKGRCCKMVFVICMVYVVILSLLNMFIEKTKQFYSYMEYSIVLSIRTARVWMPGVWKETCLIHMYVDDAGLYQTTTASKWQTGKLCDRFSEAMG